MISDYAYTTIVVFVFTFIAVAGFITLISLFVGSFFSAEAIQDLAVWSGIGAGVMMSVFGSIHIRRAGRDDH